MKFLSKTLFVLLTIASTAFASKKCKSIKDTHDMNSIINPQNNCISFSVGQGTGCAWICNYCASNLGTNNYYFTTGVCTYQEGGCVGNPQSGVTYTCCSA